MVRALTLLLCTALAAIAASGPAAAANQVYAYRVTHARYGDIGTYTNVVERTGDAVRVDSELHLAVRILGIVVFREEARRSEYWRNDRLVSFDGVTVTNGDKLELRGEARDGGFAVITPSGTVMAPAGIHPSNPWSAMVLNADVMMSTKSGRVTKVRVTGGEEEPVAFNGNTLRVHQYEIFSDKHQTVWFDDRGVAVGFRTEANGDPVDFVLVGGSEEARRPD
jgi:hypothetical protein